MLDAAGNVVEAKMCGDHYVRENIDLNLFNQEARNRGISYGKLQQLESSGRFNPKKEIKGYGEK